MSRLDISNNLCYALFIGNATMYPKHVSVDSRERKQHEYYLSIEVRGEGPQLPNTRDIPAGKLFLSGIGRPNASGADHIK